MDIKRVAAIDVGSNSVRLMVADMDDSGYFKPIYRDRYITRLATGLNKTGRLADKAMEETTESICLFINSAREQSAEIVHVFATAAVRDAINKDEFIKMVHIATSTLVDVLSEEVEAFMAFSGVGGNRCKGIIDIGGGSTEIAVGLSGEIKSSVSVRLGAVRASERYPHGDIPDPLALEAMGQWMKCVLDENLSNIMEAISDLDKPLWFGVGGTISTLAAMIIEMEDYEPSMINGMVLSRGEVSKWLDKLAIMSLSDRQSLPGLPEKRADIIVSGIIILDNIMTKLSINEIYVSTSDNLEGYLKHKFKKEF